MGHLCVWGVGLWHLQIFPVGLGYSYLPGTLLDITPLVNITPLLNFLPFMVPLPHFYISFFPRKSCFCMNPGFRVSFQEIQPRISLKPCVNKV